MSEKVFYAKCLYATATITAGKKYLVSEDDGDKIVITNNHGKISLMKYRFSAIEMKDSKIKNNENSITCISAGKFRSITHGNEYIIDRETRDFYYIKNDIGTINRYGKKYFKVVIEKEKILPPKVMKAVCVFPVLNELTYREAYSYEDIDESLCALKNDKEVKKTYLKKRFKFEMV